MRTTEHRSSAHGLSDLLKPFGPVADGVYLNLDGSLTAGWQYRGQDMMSAQASELASQSARLNEALRMGSGWMVQCDAIRSEAPSYPAAGAFPDPISRMIDEERRQQFLAEGAHYESSYFLTLTYAPPLQMVERIKGWMFVGQKKNTSESRAATRALDYFQNRLENFENVFAKLFLAERLRSSESTDEFGCVRRFDSFYRYFRRCLNGMDYPFSLSDIPCFMSDVLAVDDFVGGVAPRIGRRHISVVAIDGFPEKSYPGILRELDSLPMEYRWNSRALLMDGRDANKFFETLESTIIGAARGWKQHLSKHNPPVTGYAGRLANEAKSAADTAIEAQVQFCSYSDNIVVLHEDEDELRDNTRVLMSTIQNLGFGCRNEDVNAIAAWHGTLPCEGYANRRRVKIHTLNLADMLPITAVWAGHKANPSALMPVDSPPLFFGATTGGTPYRGHLHVSDLGHSLIVGPPGTGKSTLDGLLMAQWFRYPNAQVFCFDRGYSSWFLTTAMGGDFYDLAGPNNDISFCPLEDIGDDHNLQWAATWIERLCELNGLKVGPKHRNAIADALRLLQVSPTRTLTELSANVQDHEIRSALQHYTIGSPGGSLLDSERDSLRDGRFITFETENLLQLDDKAVVPVLLYLFHRIEQRLDGRPTLIVLDEAWSYLDHPIFERMLKDWLKTMRRKNCAVLLTTQQISDAVNSGISNVIMDNTATKIYLPNAQANISGTQGHPGIREYYQAAGLNAREIDLLQVATPKMHYYFANTDGRRHVDLNINPATLAFVGVNSKDDRRQAEKCIAHYPGTWREEWLRQRGAGAWADWLSTQYEMEPRPLAAAGD